MVTTVGRLVAMPLAWIKIRLLWNEKREESHNVSRGQTVSCYYTKESREPQTARLCCVVLWSCAVLQDFARRVLFEQSSLQETQLLTPARTKLSFGQSFRNQSE